MSLLYSSSNSIPAIRTKPPNIFLRMFLTVVKFGRLASLPERDEQYHRTESLTRRFEGAGYSGYKRSVVVLAFIKLYDDYQKMMLWSTIGTDTVHSSKDSFDFSNIFS